MKQSSRKKSTSSKSADFQSNPFKLLIHGLDKLFNYNLGWGVVLLIFGLMSTPQYFSDNNYNSDMGFENSEFTEVLNTNSSIPILNSILIWIGFLLIIVTFITLLQGISSYIAFKTSREEKASFSETFSVIYSKFPRLFVTQLLSTLRIIGGLFLLVVPGIRAALRYQFVFFPIFEDDKVKPLQAIEEAKKLTKNHLMEIFGFNVYGGIVPILSPALVTGGQAEFYAQLKALRASKAKAPKIHWLNYLAIFLTVGLIIVGILAYSRDNNSDFDQPSDSNYYAESA